MALAALRCFADPGPDFGRRGVRRRREQAGFTLVETLAAFAMLALILVVVFGGLSRMATGGHHAEVLREALQLAQARLDGVGIIEPLAPGESTGRTDNGFEWRLRVGEPSTIPQVPLTGAWVEVTVSQTAGAERGATVSLVTFKLAGAVRR